mmetsp:Transcript_10022/g.15400  ORF Transcript_10022/g.15400 Transcript_10022/m.15400 type:complete len:260 (+) Transcript_10022:3-782(+)
MNGQLGMPSLFPKKKGGLESIFNFFRWVCPFISLFLVPRVPIQSNDADIDSAGKYYQTSVHCTLALFAFFLSPLLEFIQSVRSLGKYFSTNPRGEKVVPGDATEKKTKLERVMWFVCMSVVTFMSLATLYTGLYRFNPSQDGALKYGPLGNVRSFIFETLLIKHLAVVFVFLGLAQLHECATGDIARFSWVYLIPFAFLGAKILFTTLKEGWMAFDIEKNYLELLGLTDLVQAASACSNNINDDSLIAECCTKAYAEHH